MNVYIKRKWFIFKIRMQALNSILFRHFVLVDIREYDGYEGRIKFATYSVNDLEEKVQLGLMEIAAERYKKLNNL